MPADADKHHVRLGKSESVSDGDFNRILDEAAGILASSGPVGDERTSSHGDSIHSSKYSLLLASAIVDAFKRGVHSEDLPTLAFFSSWLPSRMDLVKEKLLNPFTARWKSGPSAETGRFPQIVDVDWRLDVLVKDSTMTSSDDVRFHLQFATVSRDSPSSEKIVCSVEDLESMVHTLREAVACLKTNVS